MQLLNTISQSRYNKLCGSLRSYAHRVSLLPSADPFRSKMEGQILSKMYDMGVLNSSAKLSDIENKITVAAFCRRRLAVVMCMSKMAETVSAVSVFLPSDGATFSQIHLGCEVHRTRTCPCGTRYNYRPGLFGDPVGSYSCFGDVCSHYLSRHMEDFVTWVDTSKLKRTIMRYNDEVCLCLVTMYLKYRSFSLISLTTLTCYNPILAWKPLIGLLNIAYGHVFHRF